MPGRRVPQAHAVLAEPGSVQEGALPASQGAHTLPQPFSRGPRTAPGRGGQNASRTALHAASSNEARQSLYNDVADVPPRSRRCHGSGGDGDRSGRETERHDESDPGIDPPFWPEYLRLTATRCHFGIAFDAWLGYGGRYASQRHVPGTVLALSS